MHTLTMPLADAILASKALLNHVSTDDVTPVITHAAIIEHEGKQYLCATDRYSFGRFMLGAADTFTGEVGQMIPRDALLWVSKIIPKNLRRGFQAHVPPSEGGYAIRFTWTPSPEAHGHGNPPSDLEVAVLWGEKPERTQTYGVVNGNFPPVARLWKDDLPESTPASLALSHSSLSKAVADLALFEGKGTHVSVKFQFQQSENPNKPGPVQYRMGPADRWTAALQPSLLLR